VFLLFVVTPLIALRDSTTQLVPSFLRVPPLEPHSMCLVWRFLSSTWIQLKQKIFVFASIENYGHKKLERCGGSGTQIQTRYQSNP